ncbi:MAG: dTMP kinase [Planctomycetaceae bacterium]|nr:dTMP kinase [Planctomycetaceae bacterium]
MFLSLDGGDGCGKSTQQKLLGDYLTSLGHSVVLCRDPGTTALGDAVRNILLHGTELNIADRTEVLLFCAARCQLVEEVVKPALKCGKTVISDRFLLSTLVYQGYAGGVPLETLEAASGIATDGIVPDLTFVLDIPCEVAVRRLGQRGTLDRMEQKGAAYHQKVRSGFLDYAAKHSDRFAVVDATPPPEMVADTIKSAFDTLQTAGRMNGIKTKGENDYV